MPSAEERERRKAIRDSLRSAEIEPIRSSLPLEPAQMKSPFDFVSEKLGEAECDHTLQHTLRFLEHLQVSSERVVAWLQDEECQCRLRPVKATAICISKLANRFPSRREDCSGCRTHHKRNSYLSATRFKEIFPDPLTPGPLHVALPAI